MGGIEIFTRSPAEQGTFDYLPELVSETTDSGVEIVTLPRDLSEMKKYRGRRSKISRRQRLFVVDMLDRHPKMEL